MNTVLLVASAAAVLIAVERLSPLVVPPRVPWWIARVVAFNLVQVGVVLLAADTWEPWLAQWRVVDGAALGTVGGAALGYLATTFVFYWWHRARHRFEWLWRFHRVHHSPVRVEVAMSFYKHPLEMAFNSLLMSALLLVVLGLPPATVAIVVAITGVAEILYHANVRTPYALGFAFQRPEMHRRHHERGHHRDNFSDLPLWDLLFGTFHNPREPARECGYPNGRELDVLNLLLPWKLARNRNTVRRNRRRYFAWRKVP